VGRTLIACPLQHLSPSLYLRCRIDTSFFEQFLEKIAKYDCQGLITCAKIHKSQIAATVRNRLHSTAFLDKQGMANSNGVTPHEHTNDIPDIVIGRLPVYLRTLKMLMHQGQAVTSSQELGELLGISSAQIRKDLSHFGEFGKQGTGYNIDFLCGQLEEILKVDCVWPVVLVGAGYLGHALIHYNGFGNRGFRIVAVFDSNPEKIGQPVGQLSIQPMDEVTQVITQYKCQIAIIVVPAGSAQNVADVLIDAGIKSILCYAPRTLTVPKDVRVEYIDPVIQLQHMTFYLDKNCIDE
jgi:redox-sensing transcriptional repressor